MGLDSEWRFPLCEIVFLIQFKLKTIKTMTITLLLPAGTVFNPTIKLMFFVLVKSGVSLGYYLHSFKLFNLLVQSPRRDSAFVL